MAMGTSYFLLLVVVIATTSVVVPTMAPAPGSTSFLRASCAHLQRAEACYNLLLPYADSFNGSLIRVARTSATIALAHQHNFTGELARLKVHGTGAGRIADGNLDSCFEAVAASDDSANDTLTRLNDLITGVENKTDFETEVFMIRSWFDKSQTEMMQCIDWIHISGEPGMSSPVLKEVIAGCTTVAPYLEIAGALMSLIKF